MNYNSQSSGGGGGASPKEGTPSSPTFALWTPLGLSHLLVLRTDFLGWPTGEMQAGKVCAADPGLRVAPEKRGEQLGGRG